MKTEVEIKALATLHIIKFISSCCANGPVEKLHALSILHDEQQPFIELNSELVLGKANSKKAKECVDSINKSLTFFDLAIHNKDKKH